MKAMRSGREVLSIWSARGLEGPVDEHGAADDVFAGDESPEAAVEGLGAVVAHGEDEAGGDDQVAADDVVGEIDHPAGGDVGVVGIGRDAGKSSR